MTMPEAECTRCKGTFVPHGIDMEDLIHCYTDDGKECGGIGVITGEWIAPGEVASKLTETRGELVNLTPQEAHGIDNPNCADPDCEFHHPELIEGLGDTPFQEEDYTTPPFMTNDLC